MKTVILYHSFSGVTRGIAERVQATTGADLVEVRPVHACSRLSAYTRGSLRARGGKADAVEPGSVDVGAYDRVVVGTPVWAGRATPVIAGALVGLTGIERKRTVIFATCGAQPGEALAQLRAALEAKGAAVVGAFSFSTRELGDEAKIGALAASAAA